MSRLDVPESMVSEALLAARVGHLTHLAPPLAVGNATLATLLMWPLWSSDVSDVAAIWYACALAYSVYLLAMWLYLKRGSWPSTQFTGAKLSAVITATIGGSLWGAVSHVLIVQGDLVQQTITLVCQGIVASCVAANLSLLPRLCYPFLISLTTLLLIGLVDLNDPSHLALAGMSFLFAVALGGTAFVGNRRFEESVRSHFIADEASAYLDDAINSMDEAFAVFSAEGAPVVVNTTYKDLFGEPLPRDDLKGSGTQTEQTEDGRWLRSKWRETRHGGTVYTCADITNLKLRESDLMNARDRAENANRAKTEFLALMSHELRTPLNVIIGFSDVIRLGMLDLNSNEKIKEYATHIAGSGSHLLKLINDILDLSKIEAGKYEMVEESIDLNTLCQGLCVLLATQAEKYGVTLVNDMEDSEIRLTADDRMLNQMLMNLLSNAIKFSRPQTHVLLTSKLTDEEFIFEIIDQGIGIAAEDLEHVFEPFYQVESQLNRSIEGTGLGVSIVKRLVEHHGGRMTLDSVVGEGTTARLHFPIERLHRGNPGQSDKPALKAAHL